MQKKTKGRRLLYSSWRFLLKPIPLALVWRVISLAGAFWKLVLRIADVRIRVAAVPAATAAASLDDVSVSVAATVIAAATVVFY